MANEEITLALQPREVIGKAVKALRRDGLVPAVIHDHGKTSLHVMAPYADMVKTYQLAGKHHPVSLSVGKKDYLSLIKDADFDPKKHQLRHLVFNAINQDEKVEAEVPIQLEGDIPAEKASLMVITNLDTVQIEALPKNLPDVLTVDAGVLAEVGDRIHVSDIRLPSGVTILTDPEQTVATVEMPKDQIAEADAAAAALAEDKAKTEEAEAPEAAEGEVEAEPEGEAEAGTQAEEKSPREE